MILNAAIVFWCVGIAVALVTALTVKSPTGMAPKDLWFVALLFGWIFAAVELTSAYRRRPLPPDPLAALDSMSLSWADPEHPAYEPNPDVRALIEQGWPVAQARDMVRVEGGDPDAGPLTRIPPPENRVREYEAWLRAYKNQKGRLPPPAAGSTRTVRFDFGDETLTNSGTRSKTREQWLAETRLFHLDRQRRAAARGTYRIEVVDRHGRSHWGPSYVTREDALEAMPDAVAAVNASGTIVDNDYVYLQIVRLDADDKWTPT